MGAWRRLHTRAEEGRLLIVSTSGVRERAARLGSFGTLARPGLGHWHWRTTATTIVATPIDRHDTLGTLASF